MLSTILRTAASSLQTPVVFLLIVLAVVTVMMVGMLIAEFVGEHRNFKLSVPTLIDDLQDLGKEPREVIEGCGLLRRQRDMLLELLAHPDASDGVRESLAVSLVADEQHRLDNRVKASECIAKIAPMLGLMGTLIPLGPGLVAIGEGNTEILAQSLLLAFDTTIMGLAVAAVAFVITLVHKAWYARYMSGLEAAAECVLELAGSKAPSSIDAEGKA